MKKQKNISRRVFVITSAVGTLGIASGFTLAGSSPVVSVVRIKDDNIAGAVEEAIEWLGGIEEVCRDKQRIMLKPNLVGPDPNITTKPEVIRALAELMLKAGKEVSIGEGSASAPGFNADEEGVHFSKDPGILDPMQQYVFDQLGYTDLAQSLGIPLINLHTGEMVEVEVPDAYVFNKIVVHKSLSEIDLLCTVPMMKTHVLARVSLGMKNLMGLYPGSAYCSVRSCIHNESFEKKSPCVSFEIMDMVRACPPGLTVIDASTSMEGNGPTDGNLVKTDLIIAGTNPLATDMVAAKIMGFHKNEIATLAMAIRARMRPSSLDAIEIRGEQLETVQMAFKRPDLVPWSDINSWYGVKEIHSTT
ncbi:MAG: hypothetical protein DRJ29_10220 [Bacteroidetes bacterium]|nr:MAG: hypothetical protein DRJ29_10220 [Bacteroidota bacterium]